MGFIPHRKVVRPLHPTTSFGRRSRLTRTFSLVIAALLVNMSIIPQASNALDCDGNWRCPDSWQDNDTNVALRYTPACWPCFGAVVNQGPGLASRGSTFVKSQQEVPDWDIPNRIAQRERLGNPVFKPISVNPASLIVSGSAFARAGGLKRVLT